MEKQKRRSTLFLLWFFLIAGLLSLLYSRYGLKLIRASTTWPSVEGQVVSASVEHAGHFHKGPDYYASVTYRYQVDGEVYTSNRYELITGGRYYYNRDDAAEEIRPYPVGASVQVFYDPSDPAQAVLSPGPNGSVGFIFVMGICLCLFGPLIYWLVMR